MDSILSFEHREYSEIQSILGEIQFFGFHGPPTPARQEPFGKKDRQGSAAHEIQKIIESSLVYPVTWKWFKSYGTLPIIIFTPGINSFISSNNHMTFWRCNITCFSTNFTDFVPIIIYLFIHVSIVFLFRYLMLIPTLLDFCPSNLTVNKGIRSVWPLDYLIPVRINWFLTILTTDKPIRDEGKNSSLKVCKSIW